MQNDGVFLFVYYFKAHVALEDVDGDGNLELFAGDLYGNIAAFKWFHIPLSSIPPLFLKFIFKIFLTKYWWNLRYA